MSERQWSPYDSVSRKWLALIERRQQHVIELCDTGRWHHYFTETEFLDEMQRVLQLRNRWAALAGPDATTLLPMPDLMPAGERAD